MMTDDDRRLDNKDDRSAADETSSGNGAPFVPAIDPDGTPSEPAAPPIDVDERDPALPHADPPDVIELPEHAPDEAGEPDPGGDDITQASDNGYQTPGTALRSNERAEQDHRDPFWNDLVEPASNPAPGSADPGAPGRGDAVAGNTETTPGGPGPAAEEAEDTNRTEMHEAAVPRGEGRQRIGPDAIPGIADRLLEPLRRRVSLNGFPEWTPAHRGVLAVGGILMLVSLLASSAGAALVVGTTTVSILVLLGIARLDVFERESTLLISGIGGVGLVLGVVFGLLGSWLTGANWFDTGKLNYGAGGFGGRFAEVAGSAPFSVWILNGLILPLITLAAIAAAPVALRRLPQFRNEVMDGAMLVATSAAGFAIGGALVYWWPMLAERGPQTSVGDWTLVTIGAVVVRPVAVVLAGAMLGVAVWRYMVTPDVSRILLPAAGGVGVFLLLTFGSIQLQPAGLWPEVIWTSLIAAAAFVLAQMVLRSAVANDRSVMGEGRSRVVCPACRSVTPAGMFCANCGERLTAA